MGAPNGGCQCTGEYTSSNSWGCGNGPNYLPLPAGWVLAPNDATSTAVADGQGWSTMCVVLADGSSWGSANQGGSAPGRCGFTSRNYLATSGGTYTVTVCTKRVLARCG
eukprot:COSAG04_NODE_403_length_14894_cov_26.107198_10_plen_109_part_00